MLIKSHLYVFFFCLWLLNIWFCLIDCFQGSFKVYPLSDDPGVPPPPQQFRELPDSVSQECVVRIYVVQAIDLQPKDNNGKVLSFIQHFRKPHD